MFTQVYPDFYKKIKQNKIYLKHIFDLSPKSK